MTTQRCFPDCPCGQTAGPCARRGKLADRHPALAHYLRTGQSPAETARERTARRATYASVAVLAVLLTIAAAAVAKGWGT